jgi:hypothetical protein
MAPTDEVATDEHCTLTVRDGGLSPIGTVLGAEAGMPVRVEYRVLADGPGMTTAAHFRDLRGFETRTLVLERDAKGNWTVDGQAMRTLKGCTDVDLAQPVQQHAADPAASARRRRYEADPGRVGQRSELTVVRARPTLGSTVHVPVHERLTAELIVDDDGLSPPMTWRRTGIAMGRTTRALLDAATEQRSARA